MDKGSVLKEYVLRITLTSMAVSILSAVLGENGPARTAKRVLALIETVIIAEPVIALIRR